MPTTFSCNTISSPHRGVRTSVLLHGFSLFEIVISLFILSVSFLAYAELQLTALHHYQASHWQAQSEFLLANMLELLAFTSPTSSAIECWKNEISARLPMGQGDIQWGRKGYQIRIEWHEPEQLRSSILTYGVP